MGNKKIKIFCKFFSFMLCMIFVFSCKTNTYNIQECFKPEMTNVILSWGKIINQDSIKTNYTLFSNGNLLKSITVKNKDNSMNLGYLKPYQACRILKFFKAVMIKSQTIYEVGDTLNYMSLKNEETNIYWAIRWNPGFNTESSKFIRSFYDSLDVFIKTVVK